MLWSFSLRGIAEGLVAIFVPIYLYKLGYPVPAIMGYLALQGLLWLAMLYPAMHFINRVGSNQAVILSLLVTIVQFVLLLTLPQYHWPLWLIALAWGLVTALYWPAFRLMFAQSLAHRQTGRYVGAWSALMSLTSGLAPAIGGLLASTVGVGSIYLVAVFFLTAAALPLFSGAPVVSSEPFNLTLVAAKLKEFGSDVFASFCESLTDGTQSQIWPFFIFFLVPSYAGVGILSSMVVLTSIVMALYVGWREESRGERHYLREGVTITSLTNAFRLLAQNAGHVFGVNLLSGVGNALYLTAYNTRYYEKVEKHGLPYLFLMQAFSGVGWVILFSMLWILSHFISTQLMLLLGILLAASFSLGIGKIRSA